MALDLGDIRYVKRITIGGADADRTPSDGETSDAMSVLNRCLNDTPRGAIIAIEKSVQVRTVGEQPVAHESVAYHIGFPRKPVWLNE